MRSAIKLPIIPQNITTSTIPIAAMIREARAKFFLFGLTDEPKPHTNNMMMFTRGMLNNINMTMYWPTLNAPSAETTLVPSDGWGG